MQISRYISIPYSQSTNSNHHKYLSYVEILISLLTGILLICFTQINQYVATQSQFQIIYLFSGTVIAKFVFVLNYLCRRKAPKTHLQQQSKIHIKSLFVPSFIKSTLYFGMMMLCLYLGWLLVVLPVSICVIGVQLAHYRLYKSNRIQLIRTVYKDNRRTDRKYKSPSSCLNIREICVQLLIVLSILLHVQIFQLVYSVPTVIAICLWGAICLLSYYYLHNQIFQLYQSDVDEILAKQYPIQVFNFIIYCLLFYYSNLNPNRTELTPNSNFVVTAPQSTTTQNSPKFLFILQYPIHTIVSICFSVLYQYFCFQMIKKISFKYLFLSQLTGIFWFNLYYFRGGITTALYFSTFLSFLALVLLTRLISIQKIGQKFSRLMRWMRKKESKKMIQQEK